MVTTGGGGGGGRSCLARKPRPGRVDGELLSVGPTVRERLGSKSGPRGLWHFHSHTNTHTQQGGTEGGATQRPSPYVGFSFFLVLFCFKSSFGVDESL